MEVRGEGAEGLYGRHEAGERVPAAEDLLEAGLDRVVGRADEEAQEPSFPLEQPPQSLRDREHDVSMTNRRQDFLPELLGEERRALGDAGGAQSSLLAGKRYEVLGLASPASQPGEAVFQTATIEERLDDRSDDGAERSRPRLEVFLVDRDVAIEVLVQDPVERGVLGVPRAVEGRSLGDERKPDVGSGERRTSEGGRLKEEEDAVSRDEMHAPPSEPDRRSLGKGHPAPPGQEHRRSPIANPGLGRAGP